MGGIDISDVLEPTALGVEIRHLRYFVAVAEELHFGRAAARLNMAQPPLSQQIRRLEELLGVPLFHRTKRRVELTDAGRAFLGAARETLRQAANAVDRAQRAHRGEIGHLALGFVASAAVAGLPELVRRFRARFPDVGLTLVEQTTAQQVEALLAGRIRAGLVRPPVAIRELELRLVAREPMVVALPSGHPLAQSGDVPLAALADQPFVLFPREQGPGLHDLIVAACAANGFSPAVVQEATQMQTIVGLVAAGMGLALVPGSLGRTRQPGAVFRPLRSPAPTVDLSVAWRRGDPSAALQAFLRVVDDSFAGGKRSHNA